MKDSTRIKRLKQSFYKKFKSLPENIFYSPGRIELLGNHTDHNNGKVLVSTVNLNIIACVSKRDDERIVCYSKGFKKIDFSIKRISLKEKDYGKSISLIKGILFKMRKSGYKIGGLSIVLDSSIPFGAGVSSSASYEVLFAKILSYYYNCDNLTELELARIAQFSESVYFNKPCGLLDQTGIALGGVNYIDFKSLLEPEIKNLQIKIKGYQFILINTGDNHTLLTHCYSSIKDDMKYISHYFSKNVLREVNEDDFLLHKDELIKLNERAYLRAKHYFEENKRVSLAYQALLKKDYSTFLSLIEESGKSSYYQLKNCYVNNEEENLPKALKDVKKIDSTCYSRVHGGGFAGTMLMIVNKSKIKEVLPLLYDRFGKTNVMKVSLSSYGTCIK